MELELTYEQLKVLYNMVTSYQEGYNGEYYEVNEVVSNIIGDQLINEIRKRKNKNP